MPVQGWQKFDVYKQLQLKGTGRTISKKRPPMSKQYAKEHSLDIPHVSCIEFPLKVKEVDRALRMVGGKDAVVKACQDENSSPLELRFTNNVYEHPVNAKLNCNEQILVKISVPKMALQKNNGNVQKTLKELHAAHGKTIHVTPLAIINKTFRFREMSDFQYQTKSSTFTNKINDSIHSLNYTNMKKLDFEEDSQPWSKGPDGRFDLPPPPRFSSIPLPFNYHYKKNAATVMKEGKLMIKNRHIKLHSTIIKWDDETPNEPSDELKQQLKFFEQNSQNIIYKDILETITLIKTLFETKPIWIRKHLEAVLPIHLKQCLRYALPQVSYTYTKGPWRQAYIKFGVDPKSSVEYGKYQTEGFRVPGFKKSIPRGFMSEVSNGVSYIFKFNGDEMPHSLYFQLENLTDVQVQLLLSKAKVRTECDFHDGWYDNVTMARVRRLMRYKLRCLMDGTPMVESKIDFFMNKLEVQEGEKEENMPEEVDNDDEDEEEEDDYELDTSEANFKEILEYLEKKNPRGAQEIRSLAGLIKQGDIDM
jgi:general transcription factor 3C polypeptide 5 (transcription factor C subunit 1)